MLEELGADQLLSRLQVIQQEASAAAKSAQAGDLAPAKSFAWSHKGVAAMILLPAAALLRFPWLVGMALRGLTVIAALVLQSPSSRQALGRWAWMQWRILILRAHARARSKRSP